MSEWQSYKIKDVGTVVTGNTPPTSKREFYGTEYKFIKPTDMQEGQRFVPETEEYYSELAFQKYQKSLLPKNTPCVVTIGSLGKKMCLTDEPSFTNQAVNAVIPNKEFDGVFLYYCLRTRLAYVKQLDSGTTSGRENVSKSSFSNITLKAPSLPTQKKIASVLSVYDNLIENNNKRIKILEQMAENLYKEWFIRFRFPGHETTPIENGIPKGWKYKRADEVIDFNPTIKTDDQKSFTIIPMEALSTSSMVIDSNSFVIQNAISGRRSQNGDTLLAKITPCLENGKTGFVMGLPEGEVFGGSTEFIVMRSKTLTPHYVYCIARSQYFRQTAILSMNGADGRQRVDENKLKSTKILQPTQTLLNHFEKNISPLFESISRLVKENTNLIKQRDLLLPRLMSGKLAV